MLYIKLKGFKINKILDIYKKTNSLQEGHFVLSSGLHSPIYLQSAIVLSYPKYLKVIGKELCNLIKKKFNFKDIDLIISPAMGGVIIGSKVGEIMGIRSIFLEREKSELILRRGFDIKKNSNTLVIEDVITTGKSSEECISAVKKYNAKVLGVFSIINRNVDNISHKIPRYSLVNLKAPLYSSDKLPDSLKSIPIRKPGSRFLK